MISRVSRGPTIPRSVGTAASLLFICNSITTMAAKTNKIKKGIGMKLRTMLLLVVPVKVTEDVDPLVLPVLLVIVSQVLFVGL